MTPGMTRRSLSDIILRSLPFPLVKAIGLHLLQVPLEEVHELDGETVEPGGDRPHPVQKEVVRHDRRDRGGQPGRGRGQRPGGPGGDRSERWAAARPACTVSAERLRWIRISSRYPVRNSSVKGFRTDFSAWSYRAARFFPSAKALANSAWFFSIPLNSRNLRKMMAQETTGNTTSIRSTNFTIGPARSACRHTRVSNMPDAADVTGKLIPVYDIEGGTSISIYLFYIYQSLLRFNILDISPAEKYDTKYWNAREKSPEHQTARRHP